MGTILRWLQTPLTEQKRWLFVFGSAVLSGCYSLGAGLLIFGLEGVADMADELDTMQKILIPVFSLGFFIPAAALEECVFRAPLVIMAMIYQPAVVPFALVLSTGFGLIHGGMQHILLQGVCGLIFAAVFLKCGGMQGRLLLGLLCSTLAHAGSNSTVLLLGVLLL